MIELKTPEEIEIMAEGGEITSWVLKELIKKVEPGTTPIEIEEKAVELIKKKNALPAFKMVEGYHWATCICVNDVVVHGIPGKRKFLEGDLVGIDLGIFYKGFNTDASWTVGVGRIENKLEVFLETGRLALSESINQARTGNFIGDISLAIEKKVKGSGFSPVLALVGHGVGRRLHEDPQIPCILRKKVEKTPLIKEGMVLAIEIIYNLGGSDVVYRNNDGWTISTKDGSQSALFEETIAITKKGPRVLTKLT